MFYELSQSKAEKGYLTIQMCLSMLEIISQRISNTIFFFGRWEGGVHTPGPTLKRCAPLQQVIFPAQVQFNKAAHSGQVINLYHSLATDSYTIIGQNIIS